MINSQALHSLVSIKDRESLALLVDLEQIFLNQTPKLFQQMYRGIELEKVDLLKRSIHTLKTSCRYLGIVDMIEVCDLIESQAERDQVSYLSISVLLRKLEQAYFESVVELKQLVSRYGSNTSETRSS